MPPLRRSPLNVDRTTQYWAPAGRYDRSAFNPALLAQFSMAFQASLSETAPTTGPPLYWRGWY